MIPATIMTRAVYETTAVLYCLHVKIEEVIKAKTVGDIDTFFMKSLLGGRVKDAPIECTNILGAIDRVSREISHFRKSYDNLSEYAHPNWPGLMGSYGNLDTENAILHLGKEASKISMMASLPLLELSLAIFLRYYHKVKSHLPKFNEICDEQSGMK